MYIKHELDSYEEGIVVGLVERHGFTTDKALEIYEEYQKCIELLDDRYPNCEYYSDLISEYYKQEVSGSDWESWIRQTAVSTPTQRPSSLDVNVYINKPLSDLKVQVKAKEISSGYLGGKKATLMSSGNQQQNINMK